MNKWIYFVPCEATLHSRGYLSILLSGKPGTSSGECLLVDRNVKDVQLDHMHPTKQGFPSCYMEETDNHFFSQFMTWQPNYIIYIIYIGSVYLIILDYNPVSHKCINLKKNAGLKMSRRLEACRNNPITQFYENRKSTVLRRLHLKIILLVKS